jgi:hypothetical protein
MSTQRYISTSFWDDEWIQSLNLTEKAVYLYFLSNPLTNIAGVYKITNRRITFDTGLSDEQINAIMSKFADAKKVFRIDEYIALPSWPKHQKWEKSPKIKDGIIACLLEMKYEYLEWLVDIGYQFDLHPIFTKLNIEYPIDTQSIPYICPPNYSDTDSDTDTEFDSNTNSEAENAGVCNSETPKNLFLNLWQQNNDVFNATARIESPKEFDFFWETNKKIITCGMVRLAVENFTADVRENIIERRFVPSFPDRFVLRDWIKKCQVRFKKTSNNSQAGPPANITRKKSLGGLKDV